MRPSAKRRRTGQRHEDAQHGKARTGLPEGVAHRSASNAAAEAQMDAMVEELMSK